MNRKHLRFIIAFFLLANAMLFSQSKYPADTLLTSSDVSLIKKIGILPIAGFQRISYNIHSMNCQFHPSCSNYGAEAIKQFGVIRGSFVAADRVVRCNPIALEYHLQSGGEINRENLLLIDPIILPDPTNLKKLPALAVTMSAIIPGLGRMYSGRWLDGFFGLTRFLFYSSITAYSYQNNMDILTFLAGGITLLVYGGELYGAYRTAKYY